MGLKIREHWIIFSNLIIQQSKPDLVTKLWMLISQSHENLGFEFKFDVCSYIEIKELDDPFYSSNSCYYL